MLGAQARWELSLTHVLLDEMKTFFSHFYVQLMFPRPDDRVESYVSCLTACRSSVMRLRKVRSLVSAGQTTVTGLSRREALQRVLCVCVCWGREECGTAINHKNMITFLFGALTQSLKALAYSCFFFLRAIVTLFLSLSLCQHSRRSRRSRCKF